MLSEEYLRSKIDLCKLLVSKHPEGEPKDIAQLNLEVYETALLGLQVKQGAKDAREVAIQIYNECIDDSQPHIELFDEEKAAQLIVAFALKQRGEVDWEGECAIVGFDTSNRLLLSLGQRPDLPKGKVHVTFTASKPLEETR